MMQVFKSPPQFVDGAKRLVDIAQQRSCDGIVVGVPLTPNQQLWDSQHDSRIGRRCRNFAHTVAMLAKPADLHVFIVSERYSTAEASDLMESSSIRKRRKIQARSS
jgi:RNase H-fold protein (predicted Holliday junction resolvase)